MSNETDEVVAIAQEQARLFSVRIADLEARLKAAEDERDSWERSYHDANEVFAEQLRELGAMRNARAEAAEEQNRTLLQENERIMSTLLQVATEVVAALRMHPDFDRFYMNSTRLQLALIVYEGWRNDAALSRLSLTTQEDKHD